MNLSNFVSGSSKRHNIDTRNDWTLFMFVTHKRKNKIVVAFHLAFSITYYL